MVFGILKWGGGGRVEETPITITLKMDELKFEKSWKMSIGGKGVSGKLSCVGKKGTEEKMSCSLEIADNKITDLDLHVTNLDVPEIISKALGKQVK